MNVVALTLLGSGLLCFSRLMRQRRVLLAGAVAQCVYAPPAAALETSRLFKVPAHRKPQVGEPVFTKHAAQVCQAKLNAVCLCSFVHACMRGVRQAVLAAGCARCSLASVTRRCFARC